MITNSCGRLFTCSASRRDASRAASTAASGRLLPLRQGSLSFSARYKRYNTCHITVQQHSAKKDTTCYLRISTRMPQAAAGRVWVPVTMPAELHQKSLQCALKTLHCPLPPIKLASQIQCTMCGHSLSAKTFAMRGLQRQSGTRHAFRGDKLLSQTTPGVLQKSQQQQQPGGFSLHVLAQHRHMLKPPTAQGLGV